MVGAADQSRIKFPIYRWHADLQSANVCYHTAWGVCVILYYTVILLLYCMGCKLRKLSSCGFRKLSQEESGRIMFAHHKELLCQEGVEVLHCDHIQIHWEPARDIWR